MKRTEENCREKKEEEEEEEKVDVSGGRKLISNKPGRPPAIVVARSGSGYRESHAWRTFVRDETAGIGRRVRGLGLNNFATGRTNFECH